MKLIRPNDKQQRFLNRVQNRKNTVQVIGRTASGTITVLVSPGGLFNVNRRGRVTAAIL